MADCIEAECRKTINRLAKDSLIMKWSHQVQYAA